jgi:hypothetical protein
MESGWLTGEEVQGGEGAWGRVKGGGRGPRSAWGGGGAEGSRAGGRVCRGGQDVRVGWGTRGGSVQ